MSVTHPSCPERRDPMQMTAEECLVEILHGGAWTLVTFEPDECGYQASANVVGSDIHVICGCTGEAVNALRALVFERRDFDARPR